VVLLQLAANVGMVYGWIPVLGVPLPLVSYGGSFLVLLLAGFGILGFDSAPTAIGAFVSARPSTHKRSVNMHNHQTHETSTTTPRLTRGFSAVAACLLLAAHVTADDPKPNPAADKAAFEKASAGTTWAEVFSDPCTENWKEKWFLDGEVGTVTNSPEGMTLTAGPEFRNDAHHMVLWTKGGYEGDLKIAYEYTRLDEAPNCVTILYIQATGSENGPYVEDITQWNGLRKTPAMRMYYDHMNTYHISYAANPGTEKAYIRGRRYMPERQGLKGTALKPDYSTPKLFATGVKHHITVIKNDRDLHMRVENPDQVVYCHITNPDLPVITEGRIGLRHMFTRSARYANFRVSRPVPGGIAGAELDIPKLRSKLRGRSAQSLARESGKPLVKNKIIKDWNGRGDFTRKYNQSITRFAHRVFALNEEGYLAEANAALREMCEYHLARPQTLLETHSFQDTIRNTGILYLLYGPNGRKAPGRMTPETCEVIEDTLWPWATEKSKLAEAEVEQSQTWWIYHSENHHANQVSGCWVASKILKDVPRYASKTFKDGHTPGEHFDAWTTYTKEYIRQRARKGMLLEIDSPSYTTATLGFIETCHELVDDPVLKKLAGQFIDLYWALVAEEQFAGVTGGAMTRCYPDHAMRGSGFLPGAAWHVLGVGVDNGRPYFAGSWEAPDVVLKIAHRWQEQAPYEIRQRRMGLAVPGHDRPSKYRLRTDFGGLLRYTWCTPDFIMGSFMHEARPTQDWVAISSQNRWSGVTFSDEGRVFAMPYNLKGKSILNGFWSVQSKGSMIAQQLPRRKTGEPITGEGASHDWRVFFSKAGLTRPVQEDRWFFAEAQNAFVGVCVVDGVAAFSEETPRFGQWLVCENKDTPVILEAGRKSDFGGFEAFRKRVLAQSVSMEDSLLTYRSLGGDTLTFYADRSRLPEINRKPVELAPDKAYDSPFVQSDWDSGVVTIQFGDEKRVLDFNDVAWRGLCR